MQFHCLRRLTHPRYLLIHLCMWQEHFPSSLPAMSTRSSLISVGKNRYTFLIQPRRYINSIDWCHSLVHRDLITFCFHKMLVTHYIDGMMLAECGEHKIASILDSLGKHLYASWIQLKQRSSTLVKCLRIQWYGRWQEQDSLWRWRTSCTICPLWQPRKM